ncbi:MAG: hypothetical protein ICV51_17180, partial [Flavisolibacter sp.]|nr:hypothetical protein [Flavisolibacter sp.]
AVAVWQQKQGFPAKDCDGIIGPNTWRVMKPLIVADTSSPTVPASGSSASIESPPPVFSTDKVPAGFRKGSYKDWQGLDRKSTTRVDEAARIISKKFDLKSLGITEIDIDTFQRIASAETGGKIQNFYSYDRAIVSMGFRQFTFIHNNIHDWIKKAPSAFKRYGIEIDQSLPPYSIRQGSNTYTVARIKGVDDPEALRWNGWAQRFYYAGLDYEIIVAEFLLAKEYFSKETGRLKMYLKNVPDQFALFTNFYNQSGHLRAFFHELNNAAPARVPPITAEALKKVSQGESADQFLNKYFETAKQKWPDAEQVVRIYNNTNSGSKIKIFENEATSEEVTYEAEWKDELESESSYSNADEMELESPAIENYSLAYNLSKLDDWAYLLKFKVPDTMVAKLKARNMSVQYVHNESYSNDLNIDFYRLRIDKYPTVNGVQLNAQSMIKYIRLNINKLVDTSYCDFNPLNSTIDLPIWLSDDPTGAVLKLDIKGPDNASVVVSFAQPHGWRFTTVTTPDTGRHPVSGHREFFIAKDPATGGTYFVIKGLDMMSTGLAGLGFPIGGWWGFRQADFLWKSMREKVMAFINLNGGRARQDITYSERIEWRYVYYRYKNLLEETFGKGAGSAERSPFFSFQLAEEG